MTNHVEGGRSNGREPTLARTTRVLGLTLEPIGPDGARVTRNSLVFHALRDHVGDLQLLRPALPRMSELGHRVRYVNRSRGVWRARATLSERHFSLVSRRVQQEVSSRHGAVDILLQHQTLFAPVPPGQPFAVPYAIYTDNIYAVTLEHYADWEPLRPRESARWLELERWVCREASFVFTKSAYVREAVISAYGCDPARVVAVGSGANLSDPEPRPEPVTRPIALFVGGDFDRKGGRTLLDAWATVGRVVPGAELWIAGPEPREATPGVRWLGRVSTAQLRELYRQAAAFVMPSHFETWGNVYVEAMGFSLPCIGSDFGASREIIDPGKTGWLVQRDDPDELEDALIDLLSSPERAHAMGVAGHAKAHAQFMWPVVAERMLPAIAATAAGELPQSRRAPVSV